MALHHPPIPVPMTRAAELIELHDQHLLAEVITGTDVRGVIGGHFHFSSYSTFAGVPVSVASATCYLADPAPADRLLSAVDGHQSITMMHLYDDRIVHSVVPIPDAGEVAGYPFELAAQIEGDGARPSGTSCCRRRTRRSGRTRTRWTERAQRRPGSTIGTTTSWAYSRIRARVRNLGGPDWVSSSDCASRAS